jgi:Protein of unknown function (DUF3105)
MAKKSRTPPPPRKPVQAPQRRQEPSTTDRRKVLMLFAFAASGLIALGVVIAVLAFAGGSSNGGTTASDNPAVAAAMRSAGCTYKTIKPAPFKPNHLSMPTLTTKPNWNTFPPAGGVHYGNWAVWGFYDDPVNPRMVVHNEEHGGVVLWWGPQTPSSEVDKLREFYNSSPLSMVGTPIEPFEGNTLGSKVAITGWTGDPRKYFLKGYLGFAHVAVCPKFDEKAFTTFRDAFRGKGPEGIPESANQPGTGPGG